MMIYVDDVAPRGAPWGGGRSCHLLSDESAEELLSFAGSIGLPTHWFQRGSIPHFDVSPSWRARAIRAGARAVDRRAYVDAMQRLRARLPGGACSS